MRSKAMMLNGVIAAAAVLMFAAGPAAAQAQQKELSDKSIQTIMNYAWSILPSKFTAPTGRTIEVDKTKNDAMVPLEIGREVVKVGYISAQAQLCELWEDQTANYDALMSRERAKKTWSDQQLLYITTLHRMTIHMAAGKVRIVEKGPEEVQVVLEPIEPTKDTCNDDRRKQVKERVAAFVKAAPAAPVAQQQGAAPQGAGQPIPTAATNAKK